MSSTRRKTAKAITAGHRVIIYIRVSALMGRGGDDFHSPDVQERVIRNFLPKGSVVVAVVQDIDVSGQTFSRAGLDEVRRLAKAGAADVVAVADLSRLGRKVLGSLEFIAWLQEHKVSTWSAKEHIDDSPTGRFMLMVILGLAQMIGEQIGQQWAGVIAERAAKGLVHGSVAPMGYVKVNGKPLQVDPLVAPAVTIAFTDYAAGRAISKIAEDLSVARGRGTTLAVAKWVLSNPVYRGWVLLNGEIVRGDDELPLTAEHPPLVDADTWDRVQRRRAKDARTPPKRLAEPSHPFHDLARCDTCMHRLCRRDEYKQRNGVVVERVQRLMCPRIYKSYGPDRCEGAGVPKVSELEDVVLVAAQDYLEELRTRPELRADVARTRDVTDAQVAEVERELTQTRKALSRLLVDLADEEDGSREAYAAAKAELVGREKRLVKQLAGTHVTVPPAAPELMESAIKELLDRWPDATPGERNRLLRAAGVTAVRVRKPAFNRESTADRVAVDFA